MDALQALSATNLKIGEAKNALSKLQEIETEYLEGREKKALTRINSVLDNSRELLKNTQENYEEVQTLLNTAATFADYLTEAQEKFQTIVEKLNEKADLWEKTIEIQEIEISKQKDNIKLQQSLIESAQKNIEAKEKQLEIKARRIEDQRGTLERAINRLKEGKV